MDKATMVEIEKKREGFIRGQRFDYRCDKCKSIVKTKEFIYGDVTVISVRPCEMCKILFGIESYKDGYNKGYEVGYEDK